jgi:hypothetical protein
MSEISSSPRKVRRALSCEGCVVAGAVADAPPTVAIEIPAAPNAKAAFRPLRLEPRFARTILKPPELNWNSTRVVIQERRPWLPVPRKGSQNACGALAYA